jgi:hypothetical protein
MYLTYYVHWVGIKRSDWMKECMEWKNLQLTWAWLQWNKNAGNKYRTVTTQSIQIVVIAHFRLHYFTLPNTHYVHCTYVRHCKVRDREQNYKVRDREQHCKVRDREQHRNCILPFFIYYLDRTSGGCTTVAGTRSWFITIKVWFCLKNCMVISKFYACDKLWNNTKERLWCSIIISICTT